MFCPECGKKNENGAQFCEHCGAKIAEESKVVLPKTPRKPMKKKTIVIISIVSALVVILVVGGIVLSSNFKPSKIAVNYFVALMNNDTDKIYDYINVPDSEFTTKKMFTEVVDTEKEDLLNYKIVSEEKSTDGLSAQVKISYTLEGDKTPLTTTIYLVKDKKNKLLIFDNWKISDGSSLVEEDYDITVYKGATVKLEGVEVPEKYKEESISQRYDTYVIPAIFKGEYDAEVTLKNGLKTKSVLDTTGYDSSLTDFELSENDEVTREQRIIAKTINFSIIYGKTAFGLAKELGITQREASEYIERYFNQYPRVKEFEKEIVEFTEKNGYTETLFGRRRIIEGINSKNKNIKSQAERMAVNSVIQGTAAEVLKQVMIEIYRYIKDKAGISLLLQVHDELIFEISLDRLEEYRENIEKIMKECVKFDSVPLEINTNIGVNWAETK